MTAVFSTKIEETLPAPSAKSPERGILSEHAVTMLNSEGVTEAVYNFLTQANQNKEKSTLESREIILLMSDVDHLESEIREMQTELQGNSPLPQENKGRESIPLKENAKESTLFPIPKKQSESVETLVNRGLSTLFEQRERLSTHMQKNSLSPFFAIAPKINKEKIATKAPPPPERKKETEELEKQTLFFRPKELKNTTESCKNMPREREREGNGGEEDPDQEGKKKNKMIKIEKVSASTLSTERDEEIQVTPKKEDLGGDIFVRFMNLMTRILGQAQADAHALYQKIKERTDNIDILTSLIGKLNQTKGKIDWSKDEELKALIDKARALGVEITPGKYSWSEEEKRALKENIQMRKDTLEKITQLERTDMQRYMQEASQCHQARSNVLKLLKEVMDVLIQNLRGH